MFQGNNIFHSKLTVIQVSNLLKKDNYCSSQDVFPLPPSFLLSPLSVLLSLPFFFKEIISDRGFWKHSSSPIKVWHWIFRIHVFNANHIYWGSIIHTTLRYIKGETIWNFLQMTYKLGKGEKHVKTLYSFIKHLLHQLKARFRGHRMTKNWPLIGHMGSSQGREREG